MMIRKTALMTGVASALLFAAPVLAQDAMSAPVEPAQSEATAPSEGSVAPGAEVRASDGSTTLGVLEGAAVDATGQQALQVRAADGSLKQVPIAGASLAEGAVVTAWTEAEFAAAPAVTDSSADASAVAPATPEPTQEPDTMTQPDPSMDTPVTEDPLAEPEPTDPE